MPPVPRNNVAQGKTTVQLEFEREIAALEQRIADLNRRSVVEHDRDQKLLSEALENLSTNLEELHVVSEELRQQNEELETSRHELERERQRYSDLFEFTPDGYLVTDARGIIREANRAAATLLNASQEVLIGKPLTIFITRQDHPAFLSHLAVLPRLGRMEEWPLRLQPRGRAPFDASLTVDTISGPDGSMVGLCWLLRDITQRKQAEEALQQAHDDLEMRVQERTAELARSNTELERFAYIASHDLQEPLRMISSYTQLLERRYRGRLDQDADVFIGYVVDGAARMHAMINDLLTYSHVGSDTGVLALIDCNAILELVLSNLQATIADNAAVITSDPLPTIIAGQSQVVQLFQNLISNAIKFHGTEPPLVHVSAQSKGSKTVFWVRDNGIGIPLEQVGQLFQLFQRLHTRDEYPGTGVGLAICKKIVESHGGRIWVESQPGKGSTFYFTISTDVKSQP